MKILIVQNRMGIGDMVIFLQFIEAISKKFNTKVVCLVKKSSKAKEKLADNSHIKEFIILIILRKNFFRNWMAYKITT